MAADSVGEAFVATALLSSYGRAFIMSIDEAWMVWFEQPTRQGEIQARQRPNEKIACFVTRRLEDWMA